MQRIPPHSGMEITYLCAVLDETIFRATLSPSIARAGSIVPIMNPDN